LGKEFIFLADTTGVLNFITTASIFLRAILSLSPKLSHVGYHRIDVADTVHVLLMENYGFLAEEGK